MILSCLGFEKKNTHELHVHTTTITSSVFPFFAAGHLLLPLPMQSTSATRMLEEPSNSFISLSQSLRQTLSYSIDFSRLMIHDLCYENHSQKDSLMFSSETWWLSKKLRLDTGFIFLQWPHLFSRIKSVHRSWQHGSISVYPIKWLKDVFSTKYVQRSKDLPPSPSDPFYQVTMARKTWQRQSCRSPRHPKTPWKKTERMLDLRSEW